ncbi:hypothetical protein NPIL_371631 [Nephila pilipes]|uniref:Uncharacterized protein n=1 Tax=Nephila pilipes TaxID=299642 RepID=A0A8X6U102_NEPPI|nr:hypothetical protein NPIL_371631 [Nephila pilipes]
MVGPAREQVIEHIEFLILFAIVVTSTIVIPCPRRHTGRPIVESAADDYCFPQGGTESPYQIKPPCLHDPALDLGLHLVAVAVQRTEDSKAKSAADEHYLQLYKEEHCITWFTLLKICLIDLLLQARIDHSCSRRQLW